MILWPNNLHINVILFVLIIFQGAALEIRGDRSAAAIFFSWKDWSLATLECKRNKVIFMNDGCHKSYLVFFLYSFNLAVNQ